jgi:hypothetical protein
MRFVSGKREYVADPLLRKFHPPSYRSDEDLICVFKDTDTRFDRWYTGSGGGSEPIGIEVCNSIYTWGDGPAADIVVFQYDVINKSGARLDSCFVVNGYGIVLTGPDDYLFADVGFGLNARLDIFKSSERWLPHLVPTDPTEWTPENWRATEIPPTIGFPLLDSPVGYSDQPLGIHQVECSFAGDYFKKPPPDTVGFLLFDGNDSIAYRTLADLRVVVEDPISRCETHPRGPVMNVGPFPLTAGDTARATFGIIFSDSLPHLLLLDDFIRRVYTNNFQRPSPPPTPRLTATGLNRSVKLTWDASAESATDIIIPDSLGRPFVGYSLQRAESKEGSYKEIGRWHVDTLLVHEYLDRGDSTTGGPAPGGSGKLKNNVTYYYRLLSFDEGAVRLKLDAMESPAKEGVNQIAVIPTTEPSDATSEESAGALQAGILGDVAVPTLVPTNTTNFNRLLSGRTISVKLDAVSNGVGYTIPVTITDSVAGREHHAIIDPDLLIHGSTEIAGPRTGTTTITDIFGIGAADITLGYSFEQLSEPFHVVPTITSTRGADVPVLVGDTLNVTGLQLSDPYKSANISLILAFSEGGIDTGSTIFQRFFPYLEVRLIDASTNTDYTGEWTLNASSVRRTGGASVSWTRRDRYYLSGVISNGEEWDHGHLLTIYNWAVAFDFTDHGLGSGKPSPSFIWPSEHRAGTVDFQAGDSVTLSWEGGVKGEFPQGAVVTLTGAPAGRTEVTEEMLEGIRIVPNPYFITHEAQRSDPRVYFNYLPEECTIRIYTVALDLVKTITHTEGSREEWDLRTEGGQLVASQLLIAHIEAGNGTKTVKKFAVVVGR